MSLCRALFHIVLDQPIGILPARNINGCSRWFFIAPPVTPYPRNINEAEAFLSVKDILTALWSKMERRCTIYEVGPIWSLLSTI